MPLLYRAMRRDPNNNAVPLVAPSASALGVRPGIDVDVHHGSVLVNGKGMSVSPAWRDISILRIPKRLRAKAPGARGSNNTYCFRTGTGPFVAGAVAAGLTLTPTSATHGHVVPAAAVLIAQYESDIGATQAAWYVDET